MSQVLAIGGLNFHGYGLIIGMAIAVGWWLFDVIGAKSGLSESLRRRLVMAGVAGGVIGARLYHVIDYWSYYSAQPGEILMVWQGGLGIWGAILGGLVGVGVVLVKKRELWGKTLDAVAVGLPLAQAIGRWGNWVNGELFGKPTNLPWGLFVPMENRPAGLEQATHFQPLFLYESLLSLFLFGCLWRLWKSGRLLGSGRIFGTYLIGYGLIRLLLEPLRIEVWTIVNIPTAQWFSWGAIIIGIWLVQGIGSKHGK
jgi:phosphatidylglycerol---prolipoprotein diacylglyceryl transferase